MDLVKEYSDDQNSDDSKIEAADLNAIQENVVGIAQVSGMWPRRPKVWCEGTSLAETFVGAHVGAFYGTTGFVPGVATATSLDGAGTLVADTWFYIYAFNDGGVCGYEVSEDPPDATLTFKAGDTTRLYICPMRTRIGNEDLIPFRYTAGRFTYDWSFANDVASWLATPTEAYYGKIEFITPSTTGFVEWVPATSMAPPHTRIMTFGAKYATGGNAFIDITQSGQSFRVQRWSSIEGSEAPFDMIVSTSQRVAEAHTVAVAESLQFALLVAGFVEEVP